MYAGILYSYKDAKILLNCLIQLSRKYVGVSGSRTSAVIFINGYGMLCDNNHALYIDDIHCDIINIAMHYPYIARHLLVIFINGHRMHRTKSGRINVSITIVS